MLLSLLYIRRRLRFSEWFDFSILLKYKFLTLLYIWLLLFLNILYLNSNCRTAAMWLDRERQPLRSRIKQVPNQATAPPTSGRRTDTKEFSSACWLTKMPRKENYFDMKELRIFVQYSLTVSPLRFCVWLSSGSSPHHTLTLFIIFL